MRNMFRGIVVKSWKVNGIEVGTNYKHNKLTVRESVTFYNECLVDRCNAMHNENDQKKRLSQYDKNLFDEMKMESVMKERVQKEQS